MIKIKYKLNGKTKTSTSNSNEDFDLVLSDNNDRTIISIVPKKPIELVYAKVTLGFPYGKQHQILVNGYQSWTDTKELSTKDHLHSMKHLPHVIKNKYHFKQYGDAWFHSYKKHILHGFTYSYIKDNKKNETTLIGSYNERNAYLIISHDIKHQKLILASDVEGLKLDKEFKLFDFVTLKGNLIKVENTYFSAFGETKAKPLSGYTSWYNHYQDINQEKIEEALASIDGKHYDLFQVDDGYETFVGDWLEVDSKKFPNGLAPMVEQIHSKGLLAGIWLAPFVVETKSRVYREHPDWIYKDEKGNDVYAGSNWSGDVVLDLRNKEVLMYIKECLEHYMEIGFDFFKLDFLYAAALVNDDFKYTRAEQMYEAMLFLRKVLKDKLILGCGVPLASAFNLVDYCRIGPDVSLKFDDLWFMKFMHRERISTKVTLENTIFRSPMNGKVFLNDPDVFLLRDDNIELSKEQRRALILLNHLFGSICLTSDVLGDYDEEKKALLQEAKALNGAEIVDLKKNKKYIEIDYSLHGERKQLVYDYHKGVILDAR